MTTLRPYRLLNIRQLLSLFHSYPDKSYVLLMPPRLLQPCKGNIAGKPYKHAIYTGRGECNRRYVFLLREMQFIYVKLIQFSKATIIDCSIYWNSALYQYMTVQTAPVIESIGTISAKMMLNESH